VQPLRPSLSAQPAEISLYAVGYRLGGGIGCTPRRSHKRSHTQATDKGRRGERQREGPLWPRSDEAEAGQYLTSLSDPTVVRLSLARWNTRITALKLTRGAVTAVKSNVLLLEGVTAVRVR
jgi:hypothetical protein